MLRSKESNIRAFVKFKNQSEKTVEIHWVNFTGRNIHYQTLQKNQTCTVNTFVSHPWIFICPQTGERLCVNGDEVYIAKPWFSFIRSDSENGVSSVERQEAKINIKLKKLSAICSWKIIFMLNEKDNIDALQIPKTLRADLLHLFYLSTRYREIESPESSSD